MEPSRSLLPQVKTPIVRSRSLRDVGRGRSRWIRPLAGALHKLDVMSKVREDARRCDRCAYQWFAVPTTRPGKPRWFDETGAFWTDGQARMIRRQGNFDRAKVDHDRWATCPRCGSVKVQTVSERGFIPTAASASAAPPIEAAWPTPPVPGYQPSVMGYSPPPGAGYPPEVSGFQSTPTTPSTPGFWRRVGAWFGRLFRTVAWEARRPSGAEAPTDRLMTGSQLKGAGVGVAVFGVIGVIVMSTTALVPVQREAEGLGNALGGVLLYGLVLAFGLWASKLGTRRRARLEAPHADIQDRSE